MRNLLAVISLFFGLVLAGCTTSGIELAKTAKPVPTLTEMYVKCISATKLLNDEVRKDCRALAEEEAERSAKSAEASGRAQSAQTQGNPCSWAIAPHHCYRTTGGVVYSGAYIQPPPPPARNFTW
jgi:hypothetical protein